MTTEALRTDISIAVAATAARAGDLAGAARMLGELRPTPAVWDLLARVRAQSGDLAAADECWAHVQQTEPEHAGAAAGRRTIAAIRAHRRFARPVARPNRVATLAAFLIAGAVTTGVLLPHPGGTGTQDELATAADLARQATDWAKTLERQLSENRSSSATAAADRAGALTALAARLTTPAIPGVLVRTESDAVRVLFQTGLFRGGDQLTAAGADQLRAFGGRLTGVAAAITVTGETAVVPGGPATGGSPVALSRAAVAAERLAAAAHLPLTAITLASGDQAAPPFPHAAQNRTVTITLKPF